MEIREKPSILGRGAAPPTPRQTAVLCAMACVVHIALLGVSLTKMRPPREISIPAAGGPLTRTRLVRIVPLRTFPAPEAAAPEAVLLFAAVIASRKVHRPSEPLARSERLLTVIVLASGVMPPLSGMVEK
jgi:hypothetical protein